MMFFVLVVGLSIPFWLIGAAKGLDLIPGLPVSALMACCPLVAASILVYRRGGVFAVLWLLERGVDYRRVARKLWYLPIFCLMPAVMVLAYGWMRLTGSPLPNPHFPLLAIPVLFLVFLGFALAEELGWSGYALDPLQDRLGWVRASLLLGVVWAAWHMIPLLQAHRSSSWIAGWSLGTVANRVILVWIYNHTGKSVFAASVYHTMLNVSWQLFPNRGTYYDPRITGPILAFIAAVIARPSLPFIQLQQRAPGGSSCESGRH
jgi:membrane protease YdiL (CAAX protease family)